MNLIYKVMLTYTESDMDDWQYWTSKRTVSYHATLRGAEERIIVYTNLDVARYQAEIDGESDPESKAYYIAAIDKTKSNKGLFPTGAHGDTMKECDLYTITTVELES